ncbi:MAG: HupE/UreJ family protein [Bacteroidota bacterium]
MKKIVLKVLLFAFLCIPIFSFSHHPDNSLVYLKIYETNGIEGRFDINVNELNEFLGLDLDKHPSIEQIRKYEKEIKAYLLSTARFSSVYGNHPIVFTDELDTIKTEFGSFVLLFFKLENSTLIPDELDVTFKSFIEEDPRHENLLGIEYNWKAGLINNERLIALVFTKSEMSKNLSLTERSIWKGFKEMVRQGMLHIWIGLDHILFLLALMLPSVVRRVMKNSEDEELGSPENSKVSQWRPVTNFKSAFLYILKIVTFFTIAHTITLSLASLQIIKLPSQIVESVIALSIGLAAYHNIRPIFKGKDWLIAFVFGLFHGFGFASVLGDLGIGGEFLTLTLLGFNIGVEIGQIVIIAFIFPVLFLIRKSKLYPKFLVVVSIFLIVASLYWMVERVFDINLGIEDALRYEAYKIAVKLGLKE